MTLEEPVGVGGRNDHELVKQDFAPLPWHEMLKWPVITGFKISNFCSLVDFPSNFSHLYSRKNSFLQIHPYILKHNYAIIMKEKAIQKCDTAAAWADIQIRACTGESISTVEDTVSGKSCICVLVKCKDNNNNGLCNATPEKEMWGYGQIGWQAKCTGWYSQFIPGHGWWALAAQSQSCMLLQAPASSVQSQAANGKVRRLSDSAACVCVGPIAASRRCQLALKLKLPS